MVASGAAPEMKGYSPEPDQVEV